MLLRHLKWSCAVVVVVNVRVWISHFLVIFVSAKTSNTDAKFILFSFQFWQLSYIVSFIDRLWVVRFEAKVHFIGSTHIKATTRQLRYSISIGIKWPKDSGIDIQIHTGIEYVYIWRQLAPCDFTRLFSTKSIGIWSLPWHWCSCHFGSLLNDLNLFSKLHNLLCAAAF